MSEAYTMLNNKNIDKVGLTVEENNIKKISVSAKRQMTIPKQFYDELKIEDDVTCQIVDNTLVIKPVHNGIDFSEFILKDLVKEGYTGDTLLKEFSYRKSQINNSVHNMIDDTRDYKTYSNVDDLFASLSEDDNE